MAVLTTLSPLLWANEIATGIVPVQKPPSNINSNDPNSWVTDITVVKENDQIKIHLPFAFEYGGKGFGCGEEDEDFFILRIFITGNGLGRVNTPENSYSNEQCAEAGFCEECYSFSEFFEEDNRITVVRETASDDHVIDIQAIPNTGSARAAWNCQTLQESVVGKPRTIIQCNTVFKLKLLVPIPPQLVALQDGMISPAVATFSGNLATIDDLRKDSEVIVLNSLATVELTGTITDSLHNGQRVDTLLVVGYANVTTPENKLFYMQNGGNYELWDGNIASLSSLQNHLPLTNGQLPLELHSTPLLAGIYDIYFGYRLAEGTIIFNSVPIKIQVNQ
jgi:hypothetical protein